ncbi:sulfotransferase domain-containing protein [Phthorimaea operculella]|nr:sulfotransferase domain-containing protein [Phthorimaea operculella]
MAQNDSNFPFEIKDVEPTVNKELIKYFTGQFSGFVKVGPKGYCLPQNFRNKAAKIYNMPVRPDDVFVVSYPRTGTTWTQELVWMVDNDLDYVTSNAIPITQRYIFVEMSALFHPKMKERFIELNKDNEKTLRIIEQIAENEVDKLEKTPSPRFIKSHLPISLLPPTMLDTAKVVYVARDPRDTAVSFYHHNRLFRMQGFIGDFKTYWNFFIKDLVNWTPFFEHLKEAWEKRHHPNMLFLFYEEMNKNLPAAVRRVSKFFNKELTDEQVSKLCDHLSIENFKKNKSVNYDGVKEIVGAVVKGEQPFIRKGNVGGWRDYFDDEMMQQADTWMEENLRDTDFRFPHLEKSNS